LETLLLLLLWLLSCLLERSCWCCCWLDITTAARINC